MPLSEHLEELRGRLVRVLYIVILSFIICYSFGDQLSEILLAPLRSGLGIEGKVVYLGILDKVLAQFQVAFWACLFFASPFWFYQLWMFVRPGLYDYEAKAVGPFILAGFLLFIFGVLFGLYIVFPFTFKTLMNWGVGNVEAMISLKDYLLLSSQILVFLGLLFQLPNFMLILGMMGLVTKYSLRHIRSYVYVAMSIVAATLTPPDVLTMLCLWIPLVALYEIGILAVALIVHPYLARQHT